MCPPPEGYPANFQQWCLLTAVKLNALGLPPAMRPAEVRVRAAPGPAGNERKVLVSVVAYYEVRVSLGLLGEILV